MFGGYADAPWHSDGKGRDRFIASGGGAFLFTLRFHTAGLGPTRMGLTGMMNGQAMWGEANCGPAFGGGGVGAAELVNLVAGEQGDLPTGWKTRMDMTKDPPHGRRMYYNRGGTGETSWHRPAL